MKPSDGSTKRVSDRPFADWYVDEAQSDLVDETLSGQGDTRAEQGWEDAAGGSPRCSPERRSAGKGSEG